MLKQYLLISICDGCGALARDRRWSCTNCPATLCPDCQLTTTTSCRPIEEAPVPVERPPRRKRRARPIEDRFWAKVDRSRGSMECWLWTGYARYNNGLSGTAIGLISSGPDREAAGAPQAVAVHQLSWELANDGPVPEGMAVGHTCSSDLCVNPDHLTLYEKYDSAARLPPAQLMTCDECGTSEMAFPMLCGTCQGYLCRDCQHSAFAHSQDARVVARSHKLPTADQQDSRWIERHPKDIYYTMRRRK